MWHPDDIRFDLDDSGTEAPIVTLIAYTPDGDLYVMGELVSFGERVEVDRAHTFGPAKGSFGIKGLRAVARAFLEQFDVEELIIKGEARTTGASPGRKPRPFRYRRGRS